MTLRAWGCFLVATALLPAQQAPSPAVQEQAPAKQPDVIFVPTPNETVMEMLKLANVQPSDTVYDLGCGDGRIVIMAAEKFGAKGVGIDIDPQRIRESRENAKQAKLEDKVTFRQEDLFEADLHDATVVTLYLLTSLNTRLKPKLLRDLKPGTRIVSHTFNMGDWTPEKQVDTASGRRIYLWIVPDKNAGGNKERASQATGP